MRARPAILIALLLTLAAASTGSLEALARPEIPEDVRQTVRDRVDQGQQVGLVVGMIGPGGTDYFFYGAASKADAPALNENSVFEIGSITKVFTSLLLADLALQGKLSLEDPIQKYLPPGLQAPSRNGEQIRLIHLAEHSSGLPRMPNNFRPANLANPYADYSVDQLLQFLGDFELKRDIGSQYEYSNFGAGLLGHLLERISGMSYEELATSRITSQLGMPDTRITLSAAMAQRLATGHNARGYEVSNWDIPTLAGAGALRSTARDMLEFLAFAMGLKESRLQAAFEMVEKPRRPAGSQQMEIGMGWHIRHSKAGQIVWHNGGTGGYRTFAGYLKGGQIGAVVLANSNRGADDIGFHLLDPSLPMQSEKPKEER